MAPYEKSMEMMPFKQRKCLGKSIRRALTSYFKQLFELYDDSVFLHEYFGPRYIRILIIFWYIREKTLPLLDKTKFLVPFELTLGQFLCLQALFLLVSEKSMSCMSASMGEVYSQYRDPDGFLYITYASQEIFGKFSVTP
uniref:Microtubule-associated protein 1 light chain 3 gamma, like n=1 Tax=Myripristis murdjan TaxID=586833 RepID=A0A667WMH7_9TELE